MRNERMITIGATINETLREEMERDASIVLIGEDIATIGGRGGVTAGLRKTFGKDRVIQTPLVEELLLGIAIGVAQSGLRPVVEFGHANFLMLAWSDVYKMGIWRRLSANKISLPIVVRMKFGAYLKYGAELTGPFISSLQSVLGIKIVVPSRPADAKGLLRQALRTDRPVLFLEHAKLYGNIGPVSDDRHFSPLDEAVIRRSGTDLSIISYGYLLAEAEKAARTLAAEGVSVEVIDLVSLKPLDQKTLIESAQKTKKIIVFDEETQGGGLFPFIFTIIKRSVPDARVESVGSRPVPLPFGPAENFILPQSDDLMKALRTMLSG